MSQFKKFALVCLLLTVGVLPNLAAAQALPSPMGSETSFSPVTSRTSYVNPEDMSQLNNTVTTPTTAAAAATCTSFTQRATEMTSTTGSSKDSTMLLTTIYTFIKSTVNSATKNLYSTFIANSGYQNAVYWSITLMVLFYGVGFTIGVMQPSFQQVLIRLVKIGFIFALIAPNGGWEFFNQYVVGFFQDGSDDLIMSIEAIGFGVPAPTGANATPFYALDKLASFFFQPDTIIAMMGSILNGGPFGMTMGGLLILATYGFFALIVETLQIYAVCFVARALVLGVAPIFIVFLLFDKTKQMFVSWVNTLLNLSLQPILLFTFLSFFLVMMQGAAKDMLGVELCWGEAGGFNGSGDKFSFWTFRDPVTHAPIQEPQWNGSLSCILEKQTNPTQQCPSFPIHIVDMLSFLILVYLANRFTEVVKRISQELSSAFVNLDNQSRLDVEKANDQAGTAAGNIGKVKSQGDVPQGVRKPGA